MCSLSACKSWERIYQKCSFLTWSYITVMWLPDEWVRSASWYVWKLFVVGSSPLGELALVIYWDLLRKKRWINEKKGSVGGDKRKGGHSWMRLHCVGFLVRLLVLFGVVVLCCACLAFFPPFSPCSATGSFFPAVLIYSCWGSAPCPSLAACCIPAPYKHSSGLCWWFLPGCRWQWAIPLTCQPSCR